MGDGDGAQLRGGQVRAVESQQDAAETEPHLGIVRGERDGSTVELRRLLVGSESRRRLGEPDQRFELLRSEGVGSPIKDRGRRHVAARLHGLRHAHDLRELAVVIFGGDPVMSRRSPAQPPAVIISVSSVPAKAERRQPRPIRSNLDAAFYLAAIDGKPGITLSSGWTPVCPVGDRRAFPEITHRKP